MAELKTQRNNADVGQFLASVSNASRRRDAETVCALMTEVTGEQPTMWGASIVGFGSLKYRYSDGRLAEWFIVGLAPRKQSLTLYLMDGFDDHAELLDQLGPHSIGRSCLYIKRLDAINIDVLRQLITGSIQASKSGEPQA